MIIGFIRGIIGDFGNLLLDFYEANSLIINSLVILYGLAVFFAHRSFYTMLGKIKEQLKFDEEKNIAKTKLTVLIEKTSFNWDALRKTSWFPLIALPGKMMVHIPTQENLEKIFSTQNLVALLTPEEKSKN